MSKGRKEQLDLRELRNKQLRRRERKDQKSSSTILRKIQDLR